MSKSKNKQQNIEQFDLSPLAKAGVFVVDMHNKDNREHDISKPHRDNHYQLLIATGGSFRLNIDFEEVEFNVPTILCIFPDQVHNTIEVVNPRGWIINFDSSLVDQELGQLMENKMTTPMAFGHKTAFYQHITSLMTLIEQLQSENINTSTHKTIHALLNALLSLITADIVTNSSIQKEKGSRGIIITTAFNKLIKQHNKIWKHPAQYASALSVSVAHLNDTVKELTGNPASVHIQQASILEAKRLLFFTDNSVKEIAYEVGYVEPVYFGKLFKKVTNLTPLEFRKKFRD